MTPTAEEMLEKACESPKGEIKCTVELGFGTQLSIVLINDEVYSSKKYEKRTIPDEIQSAIHELLQVEYIKLDRLDGQGTIYFVTEKGRGYINNNK